MSSLPEPTATMRKLYVLLLATLLTAFSFGQTITGNSSFCQGGNTVLSVTGAPTSATYKWQISTDGGTTWTDITPGGTNSTYTATVAASYRVLVNDVPTTQIDVTENPNPNADFTFNNNNVCSGSVIQFTSIASSGTAPYTYNWNFGDGGTSTAQDPTHIFTSLGCGTGQFLVTLTVTEVNGCSKVATKQISVKQAPDVQIKDQSHPFNEFSNCGNSPSPSNPNFTVVVANNSPSANCIGSYSIDWGDGNTSGPVTFPITHTYTQLGSFSLVVSATGNNGNGCNSSRTYQVVNQANPAVGISGPGGTSGCAPNGFWFKLTQYQLNSPGTNYIWNFGDNSPTVTWNTPITVDSIFHTFSTTSCGLPGNQFTVKVTAKNGCDSTAATVNNIKIFQKPKADFTSPPSGCISQAVPFTSSSTLSYNPGDCNRNTTYNWDFGDGGTSTINNPTHIFTAVGVYNVSLVVTGACGSDTISKQICIVNSPTSSFTIDNSLGCTPVSVNATNTSNTLSNCVAATYLWTVTYQSANCGTSSSYNFTNNTNSGSVNPSFLFINPGIYTITLRVTNACGTVTSTKTVTVKKPPTVTINSFVAACAPASVTPVANISNCGTSTLTYSWSFPGGSPATSTSANPGTITYANPGTYTISLSVTNECGTTTAIQQLIVKPVPDLTVPSPVSVCTGTSVGPLSFSSTLSGTTFSWTNTTTSIGLGASGSSNPIPAFTAVNNTAAVVTATINVVATNSGCTKSLSFTIAVNPKPAIPAQTATICTDGTFNVTPTNGSPTASTVVPTGTTYSWGTPVSNPAGAITGGSAQTGQTSISQQLTNTTNASATLVYTVTPVSGAAGNCPGNTFTVTVTVNPKAVIPAQSRTVCSGTAFSVPLTNNPPSVIIPTGTTYSWPLPTGTGFTGGATGTNQSTITGTLTNTTNSVQTATYTVTPTSSGSCSGAPFTVTITINPKPVIPNQTVTICTGNAFTVTPTNNPTVTIVPANTTYSWGTPTSAPAGAITGGSAQTGQSSISQTLTNTTNASATLTYTVTPTSGDQGNCPGNTFLVVVTVSPKPVIPSRSQTVCSGTAFSIVPVNAPPTTVVPTGTVYTWPAPVVTTGVTGGQAGNNQTSINGTLTNTTNTVQTATYTVTPNSGSCPGTAFTVTITLNPTAKIQNYSDAICSGGGFTLTPTDGVPTTATIIPTGTTYSWPVPVVTGGVTGGQSGTGQTSISGTLVNPTNIARTATYTITPTSPGGCTGATFTYTVTVNPKPAVPAQTATICSGSIFNVAPSNGSPSAATIIPSGTTYSWSDPVSNPAGAITGGSAQTGQSSISQQLTNTTNASATLVYTVTPTSGSAGNCAGNTFTVTVTVNPKASIPAQTATVCSGASFTVTPANNAPSVIVPAGTTYSWAVPTGTGFTGGAAGANQTTISGTLINTTNVPQTATYAVTPTTSGSCTGAPFTITVTINPKPAIPAQPVTICSGGTFTVSPSNNPPGTIVPSGTTYSWGTPVSSPVGAITGGSAQSSQTSVSQTLTNTTTATATLTYTVIPTSGDQGNCVGSPFQVTVTVNAQPGISDQTSIICSGTTFSISPSGAPAGTRYSWTAPVSNPGGAVTGGSAQTNQTSITQSLTNTTNSSATLTYTVTPTSGTCGNGTFQVTVTVNPKASVSNYNSSICSGASFTITPTDGVPNAGTVIPSGTTFTWTSPTVTGGISGGSGGSNQTSISGTLTNPTTGSQTATYSVTPTSPGSCIGNNFSIVILVNPKPTAPATSPVSYCQNDVANPLSATSTSGNTLLWYDNATGGTGSTVAPTPVTSSVGNTTYYVSQINTSTTCESPRASIVVSVFAKPVITSSSFTSPANCISSTGSITLNGLTPNTSYLVKYEKNGSPVSVTLVSNNSGTIVIGGLSAGVYDNITVTLNGCSSNAEGPYTLVDSNPPPAPTAGSNSPVCGGSSLNLTAISNTNNPSFLWQGPNGYSSPQQNPVITNATPAMSGTYTVSVSVNGCSSAPASIAVTVNQTPASPLVTTPIEYCQNATANPLSATAASGNTLSWYTSATGGTASPVAPTPSTTSVGSTTYYVSQLNSNTGCESGRSSITVVIKPVPSISGSANDATTCNSSDGSLTITGLNPAATYGVQYTKTGSGVTSLTLTSNASGVISISNLTAGDYNNISATFNGCISNVIGPFTIINPPAPGIPTGSSNSPLCPGATLNLSSTSSAPGATYAWTGPSGFSSSLQNPTRNNVTTAMSGNYFVTTTLNGCTSQPVAVNVLVNQQPSNPTASSPVIYCQYETAVPLTANAATGNSLNWYMVATGGTPSATAPVPSTGNAGNTTYYVSQTGNSSGCESGREAITVIVKAVPVISGNYTDPTNCSIADGTILISGLNASTTYVVDYSKNNGSPVSFSATSNAAGSLTIPNLSAGTYSNIAVTINGCRSNAVGPFTLTNPASPASPSAGSNSPLCSGATLTLTANSSTQGVTYNWSGPGFTSTTQNPVRNNVTTSMSGTYTVTAILNGCSSAVAAVSVEINQTPLTPAAASNTPVCTGSTLALTATSSTNSVTYTWSGPANFVSNLQNPSITNVSQVNAGVYTVVTTSAQGNCNSTPASVTVNINPIPAVSNFNFTNPTRCNISDGTIVLNGLNASTGYSVQYTKDGGPLTVVSLTSDNSGVIVIPGLAPGTYSNISVTLNGCVSNTGGPFSLTNPPTPASPTAGSNSPICSGETLSLNSLSSTNGVSYSWTGPGFTSSQQNPTRSNATPSMSGDYSVVVTLNGCSTSPVIIPVMVNPAPAQPAVVTPVAYCQFASAVPLTATSSAGNNLYWYTVPTGGTASTIAPTPNTSAVSSTTYYVSQSNASTLCESNRAAIVVTIKALPNISGSAVDPSVCSSTNGSLLLNGLTPNTLYLVSYTKNGGSPITNNLTSGNNGIITISGLSAGTYDNISVTLDGCVSNVVGPFVLTDPNPPAPSGGSNAPLCSGETLNLFASTSIQGVTFSWTGPNGFTSTLQNPSIPNVTSSASGTYQVTVKLNGCTSVATQVNVVINPKPVAPVTGSNSPICSGGNLSLTASSTTSGVTYSWSGPNGFTSNQQNPVITNATATASGTYSVIATASQGNCSSVAGNIVVAINPIPDISNGTSSNPTGCSRSDGSINLNGLTPNTGYVVNYNRNGTPVTRNLVSNSSGTVIITGLSAGTYSNITVTLNGCVSNSEGPFTLTEPAAPSTPAASSNSPVCSGGTLTLFASSSLPNVIYSWTGPNGFTSASQNPTRTNVITSMSGNYSVTITDNGCVSSAAIVNVVINQTPQSPVAQSPVDYCQNATASPLTAAATAGHTLNWYNTATGGTASASAPIPNTAVVGTTTYYVSQVNSLTNCESPRSAIVVNVRGAAVIAGTQINPSTCTSADGSITLTGLVANSTYSIQYTRNAGAPVTATYTSNNTGVITIANLASGNYSNIIASLNGCPSNAIGPFNLVSPLAPVQPVAASNSPLCVGADLRLQSTSAGAGATYSWTGPNGFTSSLQNPVILNATAAATGKYFVTASLNGCTSPRDSVNVVVSEYPVVDLGPDLTVPSGTQMILNSTILNGPIATYLWTPSTNLSCSNCPAPSVIIKTDISYVLKVTNIFGCSDSDTINFKAVCEKTQVYIPNAFSPDGDGINDVLMIRSPATVNVRHFRIFNKWGQLVFEKLNFPSNTSSYGWNGTVAGVVGPPDVFVYTAEIMCANGSTFFYKGNVSIIK